MINIYEAQAANKWKSFVVIIFFLVFFGIAVFFLTQALGYYLGYEPGGIGIFGISLIISGITSFFGYYFSDSIVLGISGARPADRKRDFYFYTITENLCIATGLPKPKLYVIPDSSPNAFATGRDPKHASICVTTGLLEKLKRNELEGVVAHELSHVRNYDIRLMSIVAVMVGTIALLGDWLLRFRWSRRRSDSESSNAGTVFMLLGIVFAILSPIIGEIIKLAISRRREFMADTGSVEITRQPQGLISALEKISMDREPLEVANKATAHLYIVSPFKGKDKSAVSALSGLFNTHPPVEERIAALKKMA